MPPFALVNVNSFPTVIAWHLRRLQGEISSRMRDTANIAALANPSVDALGTLGFILVARC